MQGNQNHLVLFHARNFRGPQWPYRKCYSASQWRFGHNLREDRCEADRNRSQEAKTCPAAPLNDLHRLLSLSHPIVGSAVNYLSSTTFWRILSIRVLHVTIRVYQSIILWYWWRPTSYKRWQFGHPDGKRLLRITTRMSPVRDISETRDEGAAIAAVSRLCCTASSQFTPVVSSCDTANWRARAR